MTDVNGFIKDVLNSTLLLFILLEISLVVTDVLSLVLVRNTIGRCVKKQIRISDFWKIFGFTHFTYLLFVLIIWLMVILYIEVDYFYFSLPLLVGVILFGAGGESFVADYSIAIFICVLLNIVFNFFVVFRKEAFSKFKRLISSVIVSVLTAPYLFYFPVGQIFFFD